MCVYNCKLCVTWDFTLHSTRVNRAQQPLYHKQDVAVNTQGPIAFNYMRKKKAKEYEEAHLRIKNRVAGFQELISVIQSYLLKHDIKDNHKLGQITSRFPESKRHYFSSGREMHRMASEWGIIPSGTFYPKAQVRRMTKQKASSFSKQVPNMQNKESVKQKKEMK